MTPNTPPLREETTMAGELKAEQPARDGLVEELFGIVKCTHHEDDALEFLTTNYDRILAALSTAPDARPDVEAVARAMRRERREIEEGRSDASISDAEVDQLARAAIAAMPPPAPDARLNEAREVLERIAELDPDDPALDRPAIAKEVVVANISRARTALRNLGGSDHG